MSKAYDNAKELDLIEFDSSNNKINFTVEISSNNTVIGGSDDFARTQANAAFEAANNVGPQIEPAFAQANAAFEAANNINVYGANTAVSNFLALPSGNTAQRPAEAANGHIRFNTSINGGSLEAYMDGNWITFLSSQLTVGFLLVAGGGGGGARIGGGAGAGGILYASGNVQLTAATTYTITVGAGGTGGPPGNYQVANATQGSAGSDSTFGQYVAYGGGGGGATDGFAGMVGGSGGGGGRPALSAGGGSSQTSQGVAIGYGNVGGTGSSSPDRSGGGGGAGAAGATGAVSGNGGIGIINPIQSFGVTLGQLSGSDYYIGGGGAGAGYPSGGGLGGLGGGGNSGPTIGTAGLTNTGGGGGGGVYDGGSGHAGGAGGSGFVIVFYEATSQRGIGGTVTTFEGAGRKIYLHTYTSTGSFTFIS